MSPAARRNIQGQAVTVNVLDDFQNATRELKRLYPHFEGTIIKAVAFRAAAASDGDNNGVGGGGKHAH